MIKRLAIVPARGGSKRLINKNIKLFHNRPLIEYTLDALKKSKLFSKIHISTDSEKIAKVISKNSVKIDFFRPKNISGDRTNIDKVLKYVIERYKKLDLIFDEVWLVYATNPFIKKKFLRDAYRIYKKNKKNFSVMSVTKFNKPIEWALKINHKKILKPCFKKLISTKAKKLDDKYYEAGMFVIYQKNFLNKKNLNYIPYILPIAETIDIDDIDDFKLAQTIFKK